MSSIDLGSVTAYSIAVKYGFEGTEAEWMQAILNAGENAQDAAESAQNASNSATASASSAASAEASAVRAEILYGSPLIANVVADMEEENRVYVYVGSETGYTSGNWYYYDGTTWTSGGVYNGEGVNTDPSLSIENMPADAKAVGNEFANVRVDLSYSGNDISDNKIYFPTHHGMCFNSSGSGYNHIDINAPTINPQWNAYLIPCEESDTFTVFSVGGLTVYAYAFIDSNGDILSKSAGNYTANGLKITAPESTAYLVINDKGGNSRVYKNVLLSKRVKDIEDLGVASFPNEIAFRNYNTVFYVASGGQISFSPAGNASVEYTIGSNNYILRFKGNTYEITPAQISASAISAGLTVTDGVISGTSFMIYFDVSSETVKVAEGVSAATNRLIQSKNPVIFYGHFGSIRSGLAVDYMNLWRLQNVESQTSVNTDNISRITSVVGTDIVPSYFDSNLSEKVPEIINNMNDAGENGTTFVFITDIHWETNYKNSPALVKRVLDKTSVKNVFCGGDIINQGEKELMYKTFLDCINHYRFVPNNGFFPIARGNHDDNSNWSTDEDVATYSFDANTIYNLLYSQIAEKTTRIGSNWAFYFDQPAIKTRYIFVDTKRNGLVIDTTAIVNCLNTVENGWHVIFIMHFTLSNATTLFAGCDVLGHIVKAYNNRLSGSYTGSYQTVTYDFTSAVGKVDLIIGGHMHADYAMDADDDNNPSGIPIVATDTDSYRNHSGTEGTVNSQCFDVVTINYTAKTVKCVRIGRGSDRSFTY